jgi:hypothetical protein
MGGCESKISPCLLEVMKKLSDIFVPPSKVLRVKVIKIINEYFQLFFKKNKAESNKIK